MTDLDALLRTEVERVEAELAEGEELTYELMLSCQFEVVLARPEVGVDGPTVTVHAHIAPGGYVGQVVVEACHGEESEDLRIGTDTHLYAAVLREFDEMWWSWDLVPEGQAGDLYGLPISGLEPGDHVFRVGRAVTSVEDAGTNTAGEVMLRVHFEGTEGTEVWPADRIVSILSPTDGEDDDADG